MPNAVALRHDPAPRAPMPALRRAPVLALVVLSVAACASSPRAAQTGAGAAASTAPASPARVAPAMPPGAPEAASRLASSPRHGEYAMIKVGDADSVRAWVVYPERANNAPVVVVVHEIFGLSTWIRAVADQLAADGFIAVAPDFLTGRIAPDASDSVLTAQGPALVRALDAAEVQRRISAAAEYGMALPSATRKYGVMGFCWGGSVSFAHAVAAPALGASVVYYGGSPAPTALASVTAPVLGLYGADDARVNATVPPADSAMKALGKRFEHETYAGAGHGFLRQQDARAGANLAASRQAWARTVAWFRQNLGG